MHLPKYWALYKTGVKEASAYRMMTAASFGSTVLYIVLLLAIWTAISQSADLVGGLSRVVSYVILGQVLSSSLAMGPEHWFGQKIRKGTITNELKRPVSLLKHVYFHELGWQTFDTALKSVPLLVLGIVLTGLTVPPLPNLLGFLASWVLSFHLMFAVALTTSMFVFWTKVDDGVRFTRTNIINFLSGVIFPLYLLPEGLKPVFYAFPFHLLVDGPINVFLGQRTGTAILTLLGQQLLWIALFLTAATLLWKRAKTKLTVYGG